MPNVSLLTYITAAAIVLLVPGGALLAWTRGRSRPVNIVCWLADASALSISIAALLGLAGNLLGLRFSGTVVAILYGVLAALMIGGLVWRSTEQAASTSADALVSDAHKPDRMQLRILSLVLGLVLVMGLSAWRLYQARDLVFPPWVDSVHHTLVTRLILEHGGIPSTLEPYLPVPLVFHYGFQLSAALFAFWSGAPPAQAVLWFGQILNALVALSVFRFAAALTTEPEPSEYRLEGTANPYGWQRTLLRAFPYVTALLVGFGFQMPAYYLTWGRFTLLAGLLLLGPLMSAGLEAWQNPRRAEAWARLVLLTAGLALTHIFALLLAAFFLTLLGFAALARILRRKGGLDFLWRLAAFSLLGLLLAAPWLLFTLSASPYEVDSLISVKTDFSTAGQQKALEYLKYLGYLTGPRRSHILLALAGVGLVFALLRPRGRLLAAWAVVLGIFALPWGVRHSPFRADYFAIILFFPAALLLAYLLVECALALSKVTRRWAGALVLLVLTVVFAGWGIHETRNIINPVTMIATPADARALDWVSQNTPPDARFFTNSTLWLTGVYRGVDGGYWLMPYTGRGSLVPPSFYVWGAQEYVTQINDWAARSAQLEGCSPEFWEIVREAQLTHVYLREGVGALQPAQLANCPRLQPLYQEQGVHIYAILRP